MNDLVQTICKNYDHVLSEIERARAQSRTAAENVRLVVVTKGQSVETMQAAYTAGIRIFGENYPDETEEKLEQMNALHDIEWHMIGHLQSRKAKIVARSFTMIHSIDSLEIAKKLNQQLILVNRKMPVLIEVNVGGEESKYGFPAQDRSGWKNLVEEFKKIGELESMVVTGLMTMPPLYNDPEMARPHFIMMRQLSQFLSEHLPGMKWNELSMGTSSDFQVAVQEGATFVRIGTAILGPRQPNKLKDQQ